MHEFLKARRPELAYAWFWIWLVLVSVGTLFVYKEIAGLAGLIVNNVVGLSALAEDTMAPCVEQAVLYVAGILLWWRAIKVMVFHGAPLSFGMNIIPGRRGNDR